MRQRILFVVLSLLALGLVLGAMPAQPVEAQDRDPIPLRYGDFYAGEFYTPSYLQFQDQFIFIFSGTQGDVVNIVFDFEPFFDYPMEGELFLITPDEQQIQGRYELVGFGLSTERRVIEDYRLPTTGNYGIAVIVAGYHESFLTDTRNFSLSLEADAVSGSGGGGSSTTVPEGLGDYRIVYASSPTSNGEVSGFATISAINGNGSGLQERIAPIGLFHFGHECPNVSPDGTQLAYSLVTSRSLFGSSFTSTVAFMPIDGSDDARILYQVSGAEIYAPDWSPDEQRIAYHSNQTGNYEIFVFDFETREYTQITDLGGAARYPNFSPDGTQIVFHYRPQGQEDYDIWLVNDDGSNPTALTNDNDDNYGAAWSPDGSIIAYTRYDFGTRTSGIWFMRPDGSDGQEVIATGFEDSRPEFSPDGQWLLFESNSSSRGGQTSAIFMAPLAGGAIQQVTSNRIDAACAAFVPTVDGEVVTSLVGLPSRYDVGQAWVVVGDDISLFDKPQSDAEVGVCATGSTVEVTEIQELGENGNWLSLSCGDALGWVDESTVERPAFIIPAEPVVAVGTELEITGNSRIFTVTEPEGDDFAMFCSPGTVATVDQVLVSIRGDVSWIQITCNEESGWVEAEELPLPIVPVFEEGTVITIPGVSRVFLDTAPVNGLYAGICQPGNEATVGETVEISDVRYIELTCNDVTGWTEEANVLDE